MAGAKLIDHLDAQVERCAECERPIIRGQPKREVLTTSRLHVWTHDRPECWLPFVARVERALTPREDRLRQDIRVYPRSTSAEALQKAEMAEALLMMVRSLILDGSLFREEFLSALPYEMRQEHNVAVVCPNCTGTGRVANGSYGTSANASALIICQSCHGAGVVWRS